jgi:GNAT superfamily N-acetyltransferase
MKIVKSKLYLETQCEKLHSGYKLLSHYLKYKNELLGYACISIRKNGANACLSSLEVYGLYQGEGVGRFFMESIVAHYTKKYHLIWESDYRAVGFYKKLGYTIMKCDKEKILHPRFKVSKQKSN